MNPICICLLLPIALVCSVPVQYETKVGGNHELPNEFWSQHFGPDFEHAVHFQLQQTDLIDTGKGGHTSSTGHASTSGHINAASQDSTAGQTGNAGLAINAIERHLQQEPEVKENNKKRSAYIVHKPQANEQEHHTVENSMRVHLLQPDEIEALERDMVNYAKNNKMAESPVVVNLPPSQGSMSKDHDHETPVVLNVPPVVYHSNPNMIQPPYVESPKTTWSYNNKYPSAYENKEPHPYERLHSMTARTQPSYQYSTQYSYNNGDQPSYDARTQYSYNQASLPVYDAKPQFAYESGSQAAYKATEASNDESKQHSSFESKMQTYDDAKHQPSHEEARDAKDDESSKDKSA